MQNNYKIYKLIDPNTMEIRYIGVTIRKLEERLSQHKCEAKYKNGTYKINWIKKLIKNNQEPIIELIENCNINNWEEREIYWIKQYKNLTNTHKGGKGIVIKNNNSIQKSAKKHQKEIVQLDLNLKYIKTYNSIKKAAKELNTCITNLCEVLKGRTLTCKNFHFVYKDIYEKGNYYKDLTNAVGITNRNSVEVILNNGNNFIGSKTEVSKFLNCSHSLVSMILSKKRNLNKSKKLNFVKSIEYIKI